MGRLTFLRSPVPVNPLLCGEILHLYNFLDLPNEPTRAQIWSAAQRVTLFFASFCKDRQLPPDATAVIFGVQVGCSTHEEAALLGARNLVEAYTSSVSSEEECL